MEQRDTARGASRRALRHQNTPRAELFSAQPPSNFSTTSAMSLDNSITRFNTRRQNANERSNGRNQSFQFNTDLGRIVRLSNGINLNLDSSERNIILGNNLFAGVDSIEIMVGQTTKTIDSGASVSAAEYIAVKQVLTGAGQKIQIDQHGKAVGGDLDLTAITNANDTMKATSLVVSKNVTAIGEFGRSSEFKLTGDLENFGVIKAVSSSSSNQHGTIKADNILNHKNGLIDSSADLTLDASNDFINQGTVTSDGNLTIVSGNTFENSGDIKVRNNLKIDSSSQINKGSIVSTDGSILLNTVTDSQLNILNRSGIISANNGAINLRDTNYSGSQNLALLGGDLLSKEVNINAGLGTADLEVDDITGAVNQVGNAVHVLASTELLTLGSICLDDPCFYNTQGSILIAGDIITTQPLAIVAAGNITTVDNITIQSAGTSNGRSVIFLAGANIEPNSGSDQSTIGPIPPTNPNTGDIYVTGQSKSGGSILLGNNVTFELRSTDLTGDRDGGSLYLGAFAGKDEGSGIVDASGTHVFVGARNLGKNGAISIEAGASKTVSIKAGHFDATGATDSLFQFYGQINFNTRQPPISFPLHIRSSGVAESEGVGSYKIKIAKAADIVITDATAGADILAEDGFNAFATGTITFEGDVSSIERSSVKGVAGILGNGGSIGARELKLESSGNVGTAAAPLTTEARYIDLSAGGDGALVTASAPFSTIRDGMVKGNLSVSAPNTVFGSRYIQAANVALDVSRLSNGENNIIVGFQSASLTTHDDTMEVNPNAIEYFGAPKLTINAAGDIGFVDNPLELSFAKQITIQAKNAFISSGDLKSVEFTGIDVDSLQLSGNNSITISGSATAGVGSIDAQTSNGTLTVNGTLTAITGVSLKNTGDKGKLVIEENSTIQTSANTAGLGDITLSAGPDNATPFTGTIPNVTINNTSGTVLITGAGLKAGSPVNTLSVDGPTVLINNGAKVGNISLGGGVNISAN